MLPVLVTRPLLANDIPYADADETIPALAIVQVASAGPSMPSALPVAVTFPVLVIVSGLSAAVSTTGPVTLVLIVFPCTTGTFSSGVEVIAAISGAASDWAVGDG